MNCGLKAEHLNSEFFVSVLGVRGQLVTWSKWTVSTLSGLDVNLFIGATVQPGVIADKFCSPWIRDKYHLMFMASLTSWGDREWYGEYPKPIKHGSPGPNSLYSLCESLACETTFLPFELTRLWVPLLRLRSTQHHNCTWDFNTDYMKFELRMRTLPRYQISRLS